MRRVLGAEAGQAGPVWYDQRLDGEKQQVMVTGQTYNFQIFHAKS